MNTKTRANRRWLSWLAYIVLFIVIVQGVNWWKTHDTPSGNLSELSAELMDGTTVSIKDYAGQSVLLHFWATWCPICELQKGSVQAISEDYPVITIASWSEGRTAVKSYMQEHQLTFPTVLDNNGALAQKFGLKGVPASFILDPEGEIKFAETGYSTEIGLRLRLWLSTL